MQQGLYSALRGGSDGSTGEGESLKTQIEPPATLGEGFGRCQTFISQRWIHIDDTYYSHKRGHYVRFSKQNKHEEPRVNKAAFGG